MRVKSFFFSFLNIADIHWHPRITNISQVHQDTRPENRHLDPSKYRAMPFKEMYHEEPFIITLPDSIKIAETILPTGRHRGVFCGQPRIPKGTRYGPFTGNTILPKEIKSQDNNSVWEVSKLQTKKGQNATVRDGTEQKGMGWDGMKQKGTRNNTK